MKQRSDYSQRSEFFYNLFENSRIGQLVLDEQLHLVFVNRRLYEIFHLEPNDSINLLIGQMFHCDSFGVKCVECCKDGHDQCALARTIGIIRDGGAIDSNIVQLSMLRDGHAETRWFQLNGSCLHYCGEKYVALIFDDITELKRREKRLKQLLSLDLATGTMNKYGLTKAVRRRIRAGSTRKYTVCMIDFDNFKQLNDNYGHLFGDKVLEKFADIAHDCIRKNDLLGRYGGEEFVFIFDDIDERRSFQILKRIHTELMKYFTGTAKQPVTFSAGIVTVDAGSPAASYKKLICKADDLLYEAKGLGRSRAVSCLGEENFTG